MRSAAPIVLAAALLAGCGRKKAGPLLEEYEVVAHDGTVLGEVALHSLPEGEGESEGYVERATVSLGEVPGRLRLDARLELTRDGASYRASRIVGRLRDVVEVRAGLGGGEWMAQRGLEVRRAPLHSRPGPVLESTELLGGSPTGSAACWAAFLEGLALPREGTVRMRALNARTGRFETLSVEERGRAELRLGKGERVRAVRVFAWTAGAGHTIWFEEGTRRLLSVDGVFGGLRGGVRASLPGLELPPRRRPELPPSLVEEELSVEGPDVRLAGTLTRPRAAGGRALPVVVLIHGSGPMDRDENAPGMYFDVFRHLAYRLGGAGLAVLRYDKRGVGESVIKAEEESSTLGELIADVRLWLDCLSSRPDIDGDALFLVGHSEGGYIAPVVAAEDARVRGIVLLAGPVSRLDEILRVQGRLILAAHGAPPGEIERAARRQDVLLRVIASGRDRELDLLGLAGSQADWLRSHIEHDPEAALRRVSVPVLALFAEHDLQVPPEEAGGMKAVLQDAGLSDFRVQVLPGLDHLFMPVRGAPGMGVYADPDRIVSPVMLDRVAAWLSRRARTARD